MSIIDFFKKTKLSMTFRDHFFRTISRKKFNRPLFNLPAVETQEGDQGGRFYLVPGARYPSVTTILGATENMDWLKDWIARVGQERADLISQAGADRGTYVHGLIEKYFRNEPIAKHEHPAAYYWMFQRIIKFLDRIDNIVALENAVYSRTFKYAGRLDCAASFDGVPSLIDFKNYSRPKSPEELETAFIQSTMYAMALEETVLELYDTELYFPQIVIIFAAEVNASDAVVGNRIEYQAKAIDRIIQYHTMNAAKSLQP